MELHLTLQGKGGVGKTLVTTLISQYLLEKEITPFCIDTDPVNRTFSGFKKLNVEPFEIMDGDTINTRTFDRLIENIIHKKGVYIIDNGASSFIPMTAYLKEGSILNFLVENDYKVFIHVVITGGQALIDTLKGLEYIIKTFGKSVNTVVWLNEYFGKIETDGKTFERMKVYQNNKADIYGLVTIPEMSKETFGIDIQQMLEDRVTFNQYIKSDTYMIIPRQRIKNFKDMMFKNISLVFD